MDKNLKKTNPVHRVSCTVLNSCIHLLEVKQNDIQRIYTYT